MVIITIINNDHNNTNNKKNIYFLFLLSLQGKMLQRHASTTEVCHMFLTFGFLDSLVITLQYLS